MKSKAEYTEEDRDQISDQDTDKGKNRLSFDH